MTPQIDPKSWPDYRHDVQLTGHSPLTGVVGKLKLHSTYPLGGGFQEVKLVPGGRGDMLLASGGGIQRINQDFEYRWQSKPFGAHYIAAIVDLDADGELEIVTSNGREVLILSARTGEILWQKVVALPLSYGTYGTMFQVHKLLPESAGMQIVVPCFSHKEVLLFDCGSNVRTTKLLHALWMDDSYHPTTCIGDVNHDGIEEVVIARLGGVYVFDPISGKMLNETLWTSDTERRRNYGHLELCDIDSDGDLEAIIISDRVSRHIAVLDNDGRGEFSPLWDRFIEHIYPDDTTELRYTKNSVSDVNGDGLPEIVVSIYNHHHDERWHTEIISAASGETLVDFPDTSLCGVEDVDGDGSSELMLSAANARVQKHFSDLKIQRNTGEVLWQRTNAHFADRTISNTPQKSQFKPDVFSNDEVWFASYQNQKQFFVFSEAGLDAIAPQHGFRETHFALDRGAEWRIALVSDEAIFLTSANGTMLQLGSNVTKQLQTGYHLTTEAHISARPGAVATVISHEGTSRIFVPTFSDEILCLQPGAAGLTELWRTRGRSRLGYDNVFHAPSIIQYQGQLALVVVDDSELDSARVSLIGMDGTRLKSYAFADLPPHARGSRIGAYDWLQFAHSSGPGLFVSFYRSPSMNSEYGLAINLESGEKLWELAHVGEGEFGRGVGAWGTASLHYVNGRPEAVLCAKDTILRIDLESGTLSHPSRLLTEYTAQEMQRTNVYKEQGMKTYSTIDDPFSAYGSVILSDLDGDGMDELICVAAFGGFGVLNDDMNVRWWKVASFGDALYRMPAIVDIDGDGMLELVQGHSSGTIAVYDGLNGRVRYSLDIHAITTDIISCDINGDGIDECITGTNDGRLLILSVKSGKLEILQEWNVGSAVGSPTVAEIDGKLSILCVSGEGKLNIYSQATKNPTK
jgi:WD40 repeat protein